MPLGAAYASPYFVATIVETVRDQPTRIRFDFKTSLDSDSWVFMVAGQDRMTRFRMPRVGAHVVIAPALGP